MGSVTLILFAIVVNGYAAGSKTQITAFLTSSYGGMRNFGKIYGVMAGLMAAAAGIGPLIAGLIYDQRGGYEPFLVVGALGCIVGGILMITLPNYPTWNSEEDPT